MPLSLACAFLAGLSDSLRTDMDMHKIMETLEEVGFDGCAIPDHIPNMNTEGAGLGYSIAYMRALVQSVTKAPYQPINAQYEGGSAKL